MRSRGTYQRVAGALKRTSRVEPNPESAGSGNVININIKTSNESLANNPENIPLRPLKPSDRNAGQPRRDLPIASAPPLLFLILTNFRCKLVLFQGEVLHACTPRPHRGISGHRSFAWFIVIFNICIKPLLALYQILRCEHRPVSRQFGRWPQRKCTGQGRNTFDLCIRSM